MFMIFKVYLKNMVNKLLPEKTVERLCKYRRVLQKKIIEKGEYIYSHELAEMLYITPVQIRHDIMLIGHNAIPGKGYHMKHLIMSIDNHIIQDNTLNAAIIGMGKLGLAFMKYLNKNKRKMSFRVIAAFDNNPDNFDRFFYGIRCHDIQNFPEIAHKSDISIGIITTVHEAATEVNEILLKSKIRGILNYTSCPLEVTEDVFLEEHDFITTLEKVAYFVNNKYVRNYKETYFPNSVVS